MNRSFENLTIWQQSRVFVGSIYDAMADVKDYGFRDQIQRAAVSIMNNIAEGSESGSDAKYINFLNIAKGSCSEVRSMLYLCEDFGFCTAEEHKVLHDQAQAIAGGLQNLINYLNSQARPSTPDSRRSTPVSRLSTPDSRHSTPDSRLLTPVSRLLTPDSRPSTPDSRPSTPVSRLSTLDS